MAKLVVTTDGNETTYELGEGQTLIGRLPDCDISIGERSVSGKHAVIHCDGDSFAVGDVGSRNGTFVNQHRVEGRVKLNHNDVIQFGNANVRFDDPASQGKSAEESSPDSLFVAPSAGAGKVDIDDLGEARITGEVSGAGRIPALDVNPEAKLKAVLEISKSLAGTVDLSALLPKILESLFKIFRYADRGCILLKDPSSGEMKPAAMRHRREQEDSTVRLSRTIVNKVLNEKAGVLSADAVADTAFDASQSIADINIRSMMCVPLLGLNENVLGVLSIDSQNTLGQFTRDDLDILMTVAGQAALAYENAQLAQAYAEKQKQDVELSLARNVQRALLPTTMPTVAGYQFYASYDSARAVGGDMYDWFELPDGKIALSFGDVAGKGVPGALVMSRMASCVQSTMRHVHNVVEAICAINDHMCSTEVDGRFVTYVLAMVDTQNHEVTLAIAGHLPPIIRRANGTIERFDEERSGPAICFVDDYPYEAETCKLEPGDLILVITDGVDEAMNAEGQLYGVDRVLDFVKNDAGDAEQLGKRLLEDVRRHAAGFEQSDDITIMAFGRNAENL